MGSKSNLALQKFTRFEPGMVHTDFPGIDLLQLEAGSLQGWVFSAMIGPYHVNAGSFNRTLLYEGHYNPDRLHIGFILNPGYSAVVQAHEYDAGTVSVDRGAVPMHEIFPANMAWVNIYAPENTVMEGVQYSKKQLQATPHFVITDCREELVPLAKLINEFVGGSNDDQNENESQKEDRLRATLHNLLSSRFDARMYEEPFATGNLFRMHLLEEAHKLARKHKHKPLSLGEICKAAGMKQRTVQKYFREIYGMGPTEYFRVRRLNGARTDLLNGATSISKVALRWEFPHLGRFAGSYKTLFGESPKTTKDRVRL